MSVTRLPFIFRELEDTIRSLAPHGPAPELVLSPGTFEPIVRELASHYGVALKEDQHEYAVGGIMIRRGR